MKISSGSLGGASVPPPPSEFDFPTLPDLIVPGLRVIFVGINPSIYSVERGHYFARKTTRFWPAFSRSQLSTSIRAALGRDVLGPEDDGLLPEHGIGFTDVVKIPSSNISALKPADYAHWSPRLLDRLARNPPRVVCFHGVTGYRAFARHALDAPDDTAAVGPQARTLGSSLIYVAPNPSPANAHFRPEDQTRCYDEIWEMLQE